VRSDQSGGHQDDCVHVERRCTTLRFQASTTSDMVRTMPASMSLAYTEFVQDPDQRVQRSIGDVDADDVAFRDTRCTLLHAQTYESVDRRYPFTPAFPPAALECIVHLPDASARA
jgi:hypothetical protein